MKAKSGDAHLIYSSIMGMKSDLSGPVEKPIKSKIFSTDKSVSFDDKDEIFSIPSGINEAEVEMNSESDSSADSNDSEDDEKDQNGESKFINSSRPKTESTE